MVCTYCSADTKVINSRLQKRSNSVWRRRRCLQCRQIVTTIEQLDYEKSWTVARQPFMRDKLLMSIHKSLQHRSTALPDALGLTHTIIDKLGTVVDQGALTPAIIAELSWQTLLRFDKVAATVYKAYHSQTL